MAIESWNDLPETDMKFEDSTNGVLSHDKKMFVTVNRQRFQRSRGEEDGLYEIIVWDVATRRRVGTLFKGWTVNYVDRSHDGLPIAGVRFSDDDRSIITTDQQGIEETYAIQPKA